VTRIRAWVTAIPSWQVTLSIALLALGFLVAAQLAAEGPRVRYTTQERSTLVETALGLQAQQDTLGARILELRTKIGLLESQGPGSEALAQQLSAELEHARIAAGLIPLKGTGVVFKLEDASAPNAGPEGLVSARDVRTIIEELWLAGAEAISVNGERITVTSAILDIGGSVLVNSAYIAPPYTVSAIGPKDLYERVQDSVSFAQFVAERVGRHGLRLSVAELDDVTVPAFAGTVSVRFGRPDESAAPNP
jgi:uncharacterized protein YlxW (UPF0749 family)